jgi:predicted alpha/beta hydrolase family esterase
MKFSEETILIGHSTGSQLILSVLERIDVRIKQAILVSGYAKALRSDAHLENDEDFNWDTIKEKCRAFVFINSDNDPWGCNDTQGRIMLDKLGGTLVIPKGEGHMGSTTYKQPYKEFPLLVKLLDL